MSTNTKALIDPSVTIKEIEKVLRHYCVVKEIQEELKFKEEFGNWHYRFFCQIGTHMFTVWAFFNFPENQYKTSLDMGCTEFSITFLKTVLPWFGGWIYENDNDTTEPYFIEKTADLSGQIEIIEANLVYMALSPTFTYNEIQKILANRDKIGEALKCQK